jgi:AraC-like DNA-binding protein
VSRVASETGFFDLSHFTRHFKRLVGVAPGRYADDRKSQRPQERTLRRPLILSIVTT